MGFISNREQTCNSKIKQCYVIVMQLYKEAASTIFPGMGFMYSSDWSWGWRARNLIKIFCRFDVTEAN